MIKLTVDKEIPFREVISSVDVTDLDNDGQEEVIVTTHNGDMIVMTVETDSYSEMAEIARLEGLPPVAVIGRGDVLEPGKPDFVIGGLDDTLRVVSFRENKLSLENICPLGTLPTAITVTNVMGDSRAEVIVATNDKALRCYGWYGSCLDKLAHKVVDYPVFSIRPFRTKNSPFSRFIFGDESKSLYVYQYADDRLHQAASIGTRGVITLVAAGSVTGKRVDEILTVSDGTQITLYGSDQHGLQAIDNLRAPGRITSADIGKVVDGTSSPGQIVVSQANSNIVVISLDGRRLNPDGSHRTETKSIDTKIALSRPESGGTGRIFQAVGTTLYVMSVSG